MQRVSVFLTFALCVLAAIFYYESADLKFMILSVFAGAICVIYLFFKGENTAQSEAFSPHKSDKSQNAFLNHALAKTPDLAFLLVGKGGEIEFINKRFEQIFKLKSKSAYGINLDDLIAQIPSLSVFESFEALRRNSARTQNFTIKMQNLYFRLVVSSILHSGKEFDGFIVTLSDATHEKMLELASLERERMLAINAKSALLGEMISSISHQQRQPLSAILLSLDEIGECVQDGRIDEIYAHTARAKRAANLMNETIAAFRNFYRQDDKTGKFELKELIGELIFIVKAQMNTNAIALKFTSDEGEFKIQSVASYIRQIMLSLLANAED
ncbi:MAG: histidine kinase [Campylobacter sp.]|nr:histidine kinase [Campylobacter sp.]